jgi:hypothetical protein
MMMMMMMMMMKPMMITSHNIDWMLALPSNSIYVAKFYWCLTRKYICIKLEL